MRPLPRLLAFAALLAHATPALAAPIHTTYLWHMHQPIYWPDLSAWNGKSYEFAYETITLGHSASDVATIFNTDDRVHDYQDYPKTALQSVLDLPDAGAQVSFAGSLIQNVKSLGDHGWNGGRYGSAWHQPYRDARGWSTSGGRPRLDPVVVSMQHPINPLLDATVFRRMLQAQKAIMPTAWGGGALSGGFFPAEMCFSERLIPVLASEGVSWSIVPDIHIARACADYPAQANLDDCDPPNRADQVNPAQSYYYSQSISRGVTVRTPVPYGLRPHYAQYVDPASGAISKLVVVPAADAMSWNEGYGLYGTGEIDAIAARNDPAHPMLVLFAHDGDNAWAGGDSYYTQNVHDFSHAAATRGYEPTTIAEFLADHPIDAGDVVHVEDGGWVNADGDFGSPQFINWNWPLVDAAGAFDIPNGWAEDERNWAVLTAATNRVLTAEGIAGTPDPARIADPTTSGTTALEQAWHFLLVGHESGYMYYGTALDFEIKPTLAANRACRFADGIVAGGPDTTAPTVWLPQRLPWNPGGKGAGALWGYPGGSGKDMTRDFWVWTFAYDVSGVDTCRLIYRLDADGVNDPATTVNETYAGGAGVGPWQSAGMTRRPFPTGNVHHDPSIDFTVLPDYIADEWSAHVSGLDSVLVDYYVEAVDHTGRVQRSPIQHVWIGHGTTGASNLAVAWEPAAPVAGGTLTLHYDPVPGTLPDATDPVHVHVGHSGWTNVITPDPAMTWNAATSRFDYVYGIPSTATSVDFVFTDGAGAWDNNGGADWHVPVSGAQAPPHVIDGTLDAGSSVVASCGGLDLHADYDGRYLYVAAPAVAVTSVLDHFVFVARPTTSGTVAAPWAKTGTVPAFDLLLGNEDSNDFIGWFLPGGAQTSAGVQKAVGGVLEAMVDCQTVWGTAPATVRLAFAGYGSPDGGTLQNQIPCGDGDGNLDAAEWLTVTSSQTAVAPATRIVRVTLSLAGANPVTGVLRARVDAPAGTRVAVVLVDLAGRRVATLHDGPAAGAHALSFDVAQARLAAGVYQLVAMGGGERASQRVVVLR